MTAPFPSPERVPYSAVERLLRNFAAFLQTMETALAESTADSSELGRWRRAHARLTEEHDILQSEVAAFQANHREPLLQHASELRLLTRRMDGYALSFAGEASASTLAQQRQRLVLNAWQIAAAASGSEAAGL